MLALTVFSLLLAWRKPHAPVRRVFVPVRRDDPVPGGVSDSGVHAGIPDLSGHAVVLPRRGHSVSRAVEPPSGRWSRRAFRGGADPAAVHRLSARRSFLWHDLDRLTADVLKQYPAQARAVWELHDRDTAAGDWQKVIDRQRTVWPQVFDEIHGGKPAPRAAARTANRTFRPGGRRLRSGVTRWPLAHVDRARRRPGGDPPVGGIHAPARDLDPGGAQDPLGLLFHQAKALVLEQAGDYQAALDLMQAATSWTVSAKADDRAHSKTKLKPGS